MSNGYITIKEYAEKAGVSVQSVYKKINGKNNPIKPYLKRLNNKWYIKETVFETLTEETELQEEKKQTSPASSSEEKLISILEAELRELREQVKEKDNQLREKDNQINTLLNQVSESIKIVNQQQTLTAITAKAAAELPDPGHKTSIWKKIFKKETPGD